jgi:Bacterial extracellular solute-binding proteins, family 5 Middle/PKD domain
VTASNVTTLQGDSVNFTAHAPSGVTLVNYTWVFGDGATSSSTSATVSYTYADAGQYLVYVQATTADGTVYDNLVGLLPFSVQSSYGADAGGTLALLDGAVQENSTSNRSAEADIAPGGSVLFANWIDVGPSSPYWQESLPVYSLSTDALPYAILSTPVLALSGIDAEAVAFSDTTPFGPYELEFGETTASDQGTGVTATTEFLFTIFVAPGAAVVSTSIPTSPHPGTLNLYANTSIYTADPATQYFGYSAEIDSNVYQTLIASNGSQAGPDPADYVPDLATCVPGPDCQGMYGTSLIASNGDWTFVINPNATFYNVTTGAHYPVTPNDVAFSLARACLLADYPDYTYHGGWVLCQTLLPSSTANASWDSGLHVPLNNTPANILSSFTINDSSYCTPEMMNGVNGAGCITLHTSPSGQAWPDFLALVSDPAGGAVVISCAWATAEGLGLPEWQSGSSCLGAPPSTPPPATAWDGPEVDQGSATPWAPTPLAYAAVGSGPYAYVVSPGRTAVELTANPYWGGTTCSGGLREGCLPPATVGGVPDYIGTIHIYLNQTTANQTDAILNGSADVTSEEFGGPLPTDFLLNEFQHGQLQLVDVPTGIVGLAGLDMDVNLTLAQAWTTVPLSFPSNLMTDLNFRQFLLHSFPTPSLQSACIIDGIENCFQSGGVIPAYLAPYYPTNISWPFGAPDTNPRDAGGAAWWWNRTSSDGLDGTVCTTTSPCTFPLVYANFTGPSVIPIWATEIRAISGGAVNPVPVLLTTIPQIMTFYNQILGGTSGMPIYQGGWIPDDFDPTDYMYGFMISPGGINSAYGTSFSTGNSWGALPTNSSFNAPCAGPAVDPVVTTSCQGSALTEMQTLIVQADACALPSCSEAQRAVLYNMAENILNNLGLYANTGQVSTVYAVAPWIDASTIPRNPLGASSGFVPFYYIAYRGSVPTGFPLVVSPVSDPPESGGEASTAIRAAVVDPHTAGPIATIEAGETVVFSVSAAGGSGVYRFDWLGLPPGCASPNTPFVVCSPNGSANTTVSVVVVDSQGESALGSGLSLAVVGHVDLRSVVLTPSSVAVGHSVTIVVTEAGGLSPFTYSYLGLPPGCVSTNATELECSPTVAGNYAIVAQVVDSVGISAIASGSLTVFSSAPPGPAPGHSPTTLSWSEIELGLAGSALAGFAIGAGVVLVFFRRRRGPSASLPKEEASANHPPG